MTAEAPTRDGRRDPRAPGRGPKRRGSHPSTWSLGALVFAAHLGRRARRARPSAEHRPLLSRRPQMAAVHGLDFGPDVLVTYGPLGFLKSYLIFLPGPARLAGSTGSPCTWRSRSAWSGPLRRNFGAAIAFALALVTAALARGDLSAGRGPRRRRRGRDRRSSGASPRSATTPPSWTRKLVVYGGGPFAALELLAKLNTGLIVLALVGITVLAIEQRPPPQPRDRRGRFAVDAGRALVRDRAGRSTTSAATSAAPSSSISRLLGRRADRLRLRRARVRLPARASAVPAPPARSPGSRPASSPGARRIAARC